jgi:hypothetical protein
MCIIDHIHEYIVQNSQNKYFQSSECSKGKNKNYYILENFKFGWHRHAKIYKRSETLYICVCHMCICLVV